MAKKLRIAFLGGVGEIGKNMTVFEYGEDIIIVDCGLSFPSMDETPGIDFIIPDYSYLMDKKDKIRGVFITHGHEDHIGALPYFLKDCNVPVYASNLAIGLITHKLQEAKLKDRKLFTIEDKKVIEAGKFKVEFVKVTHSTAGSNSLCITTPKGVVFITGDFKIDHTPIDNKCTDLSRIAEIGKKGVLLLMQDSTNVERKGYSMSESNVSKALDHQFELNKDKRIIVATFASNVHRVQQIINCAIRHNRRVAFSGRSLLNVTEIARTIGELKYDDDDDIVDLSEVNKIPFDRICIISTGTQGEPYSALTRMSNDDFKKVVINELDCIMFSSSPIPGNEKMIYTVINKLAKKGASVVYKALSEIHVSGHACQEELKLIFRLINPQYFIPVHGEFRHLKEHKELAMSLGMSEDHIFLPQIGNYVEVDKSGIKKLGNVQSGIMLLDGSTAVEDEMLIRDRKKLGEEGFLIAIIDSVENIEDITPPIIIVRGININEKFKEELSEDIINELKNGSIDDCDINSAKKYFRKIIAKKLYKKIKSRPMVIPIIME